MFRVIGLVLTFSIQLVLPGSVSFILGMVIIFTSSLKSSFPWGRYSACLPLFGE